MSRLLDVVTGDNNHTLEFAYVLGIVFALVGLGLEVYSVVTGKAFDYQGYGIGSATLIAGAAGGKWIGRPLSQEKKDGDT